MKKIFKWISVTFFILIFSTALYSYIFYQSPIYFLKPAIKVEALVIKTDKDKDGVSDLDDILEGARKEIANKTKYKSQYYIGGYPPSSEGVCADVIWRSLKNAGFNLKEAMDKDIKEHTIDYKEIKTSDPNIDFRRVKNQFVYFKKYAVTLTTKVIPYNANNLKQWQRGDIVVLKNKPHIAIISDKRRKDGVPYIIHNATDYPKERNLLMRWYLQNRIIGHFRVIDKK